MADLRLLKEDDFVEMNISIGLRRKLEQALSTSDAARLKAVPAVLATTEGQQAPLQDVAAVEEEVTTPRQPSQPRVSLADLTNRDVDGEAARLAAVSDSPSVGLDGFEGHDSELVGAAMKNYPGAALAQQQALEAHKAAKERRRLQQRPQRG